MDRDDGEVLRELLPHVFVLEALQTSLIGMVLEDAEDPHGVLDRLREGLPRKPEPHAALTAVLESRLTALQRIAEREVRRRQQGID